MGVVVFNISATSAHVSWPVSPSCLDTFYSVMYDPNWNSLLMGYKRKSFLIEERIPVSQTTTYLHHLIPQTAYFLCVTCQAANPVQDQCQVFSTPSDSNDPHDRAGWELAMGVWLTCCVLLLVIAGVLLWGCVHTMCCVPTQGTTTTTTTTRTSIARQDMIASSRIYANSREDSGKNGGLVQRPPPPLSANAANHVITQEHELRTLAKLSGAEPV
ncbi:hypothetical protein NQZ68_017244 [Dissostichus eleginoides]|uniref:Fibronectin type III domain containing protein 9 n=1 Tax=Dissostichus eleginoides TaxID=100907 RepID=A0AAD9FFS0_DISEL|nr:hypothetical protein NQZ68_017244 [Dissostichus eleginoides]KAK1897050.1 Fibronectin type III domain containing protein 9 [Dissostichus eleginoides]